MSRFFEPLFCCHCFVPKNKFFHKPLTPQPVAIATTDIIRGKLRVNPSQVDFDVLVTPTLQGRGIREMSISNLGHNILVALNVGRISMSELNERLTPCFCSTMKTEGEKCKRLVLKELEYMVFHGIVSISY